QFEAVAHARRFGECAHTAGHGRFDRVYSVKMTVLGSCLGLDVRPEFVAGQLFAMAGASEEHNLIAGNVFAALRAHLRGKECVLFTFDMKVRVYLSAADLFYSPDVMVTCDQRDNDRYFKRFPQVLVEVLSPETERTDRREKFVSHTQIESLERDFGL